MKGKVVLILLALMCSPNLVVARTEAPVVDFNKINSQELYGQGALEVDQEEPISIRHNTTHQNEPVDQRVLRLERQISNLTEMNFVSKLEKIQQELQQLRGQIEVQNHDLSQLKEQVRNFYQDLDQRITKNQPDSARATDKKVITADNTTEKSNLKDATESESAPDKTKELQKYETAFNLLNKKEYDKAISGFQAFVKDYPESTYSVNAHYWLGEIFYLKDKPDQANKEFQTIIANYPDSPKVADAMLKVALIAMDGGNYSKAKLNLVKVQKQFPDTTAAKIATLRLKEIKQKNK